MEKRGRGAEVNLTPLFSFKLFQLGVFYVHGSVHRESILITVQRDATVSSLFLFCCKITLRVSGVNYTHHQEYMIL
jgi:hypothetical protein